MGFTKEVIRQGNGQKPQRGQTVTVRCFRFVRLPPLEVAVIAYP